MKIEKIDSCSYMCMICENGLESGRIPTDLINCLCNWSLGCNDFKPFSGLKHKVFAEPEFIATYAFGHAQSGNESPLGHITLPVDVIYLKTCIWFIRHVAEKLSVAMRTDLSFRGADVGTYFMRFASRRSPLPTICTAAFTRTT